MIVFVGYITKDLIGGREQMGGSAYYGSKTAQKLGIPSAVWTSGDPTFISQQHFQGIDLFVSKASQTTFTHSYNQQTGERTTRCEVQASQLKETQIPGEFERAPAVVFCPNGHEVTPELFTAFHSKWTVFLPQGWFRRFHENGLVSFETSRWKLPRTIDLLVVSEDDLVGDPKAWDWMKQMSKIAVKTLGKKGHIVSLQGKETVLTPPFLANDIDPTGAGDVFATAMLVALMDGVDPIKAAQKGSAAASYAVEKKGIESLPTQEQIKMRIPKD